VLRDIQSKCLVAAVVHKLRHFIGYAAVEPIIFQGVVHGALLNRDLVWMVTWLVLDACLTDGETVGVLAVDQLIAVEVPTGTHVVCLDSLAGGNELDVSNGAFDCWVASVADSELWRCLCRARS
jgi:hypothetical protein